MFFDFNQINIENTSEFKNRAISIIYTTNQYFNNFKWNVLENKNPVINIERMLSADRKNGFVGVTVYGAEIVENFLNAYFGNSPWDRYYEPDFFDKMLLNKIKKPKNLIYKNN